MFSHGKYNGKSAVASPDLLKRQLYVVELHKVWVTDNQLSPRGFEKR